MRSFLFLLIFANSIQSETITINASGIGQAIFDSNNQLIAGAAGWAANFTTREDLTYFSDRKQYHTWVKFDLSGIPNGSIINSAKLKFNIGYDASINSSFGVYRSSFDSWSNPVFGTSAVSFGFTDNGLLSLNPIAFNWYGPTATQLYYDTSKNPYSIELDPTPNFWQSDLTDNFISLQLKPTGTLSNQENRLSIAGASTTAPTLIISYVPEPSSLSLLLAGGAVLMAGRRRK